MQKEYQLIETERELTAYLELLKEERIRLISVDIEGEFNLHVYGEKLCLIQIYDGKRRVVIDPFPFTNEQLNAVFADDKIVKIMYDASSDASLLKNHYEVDVRSVLDLRIAVELLDFEKKNLHFVLNHLLGTQLESKGKFQRHNWTRRPLDPAAVAYALGDVIYLFEAKDKILSLLAEQGLYEEFLLRSIVQQNKNYRKNLADRHKNFKGYKRFSPREKKIFKELYYIRDRYAQKLNVPPNLMMENKEIYPLLKDLNHVKTIRFHRRIKPGVARSFQEEVLGISL